MKKNKKLSNKSNKNDLKKQKTNWLNLLDIIIIVLLSYTLQLMFLDVKIVTLFNAFFLIFYLFITKNPVVVFLVSIIPITFFIKNSPYSILFFYFLSFIMLLQIMNQFIISFYFIYFHIYALSLIITLSFLKILPIFELSYLEVILYYFILSAFLFNIIVSIFEMIILRLRKKDLTFFIKKIFFDLVKGVFFFTLFGIFLMFVIYNSLDNFLTKNEDFLKKNIEHMKRECSFDILLPEKVEHFSFVSYNYENYLLYYNKIVIASLDAMIRYSKCKNTCLNVSNQLNPYELKKLENSKIEQIYHELIRKINILRVGMKIRASVNEMLKNSDVLCN
ncbi:MAG: hypothetical protein QXR30_04415 [Candidatus Woesearchaeota archaeon]